MNNLFEVKVKYQKLKVDGREASTTENYLLDAISFGDAEEKIHKELEPYISGDFGIVSIKHSKYSEIHPDDNGDRWFAQKVAFIAIDEEKGVERRSNTVMLVQANNTGEVIDRMNRILKDTVSDYELPAVRETNLMDVFLTKY
jgi:hypothetical protein